MCSESGNVDEFASGDVVEPGDYIDLETGAIVRVHERDELPVGYKEIQYRRRFRKVDAFTASRLSGPGV